MDHSVDDLSKEELVKKCKRLLLLAQKAKQAKDECAEDLKKAKEVEKTLQDDLVLANKKLSSVEENKSTLSDELSKTSYDLAQKDATIESLQLSVEHLEKNIITLEKKSVEINEKCLGLEKLNVIANDEIESWKSKALDAQNKLQIVEEKYGMLDLKLLDFHNKYVEERNKHEELEMLFGKLKEKSEKFGSERSDSRSDGLPPVLETEFESITQKLEESVKALTKMTKENSDMVQKNMDLEEEVNCKKNEIEQLKVAYNTFIEKCIEECHGMRSCCDNLNTDIKLLEATNKSGECNDKNTSNQTENEKASNENEKINQLHQVIDNLNCQLDVLRENNSIADSQFKELQERFAQASAMSDSLNQRCEEFSVLHEKVLAYDCITPKMLDISHEVANVKKELVALKDIVISEVSSGQQEQILLSKSITQVVDEFGRQLTDSNGDLLSEMNMMNQALKERGESISTLEEVNARIQGDLVESENRHKKLLEKYKLTDEEAASLRAQVEANEKTIRGMEEEIWKLRSSDSPGDALSTSTISKVEESQRLAELEESFEEKYTKLKALAVKLKKKVVEQQAEIEKERAKLVGERSEFQGKITTLKTQLKTLGNLQCEYDALLDKSDNERKQSVELRKSLNKSRDDCIMLKQHLEEVKNEQSNFIQEKSTFEMIKKELTSQIQNLKKSVEKEHNKVKEWELEKERWESDIKRAEKGLLDEKERHKATAAALDEERQKHKKQSLLSLEMADYERTVQDMSKKLSVKDEQIKELTSNLDTQRELIRTLQESISTLESRVAMEQGTADSSKAKQTSLQEEVLRLNNLLSNANAKSLELERTSHQRLSDLDAVKLELSTVVADQSKSQERFRSLQENLKTEMQNLDDRCVQLQGMLERRDLELDELNKEFENYKVRAQSVLRQSQREGPFGRQLDIEQQLAELQACHDATKIKLDEALTNLDKAKQDYSLSSKENERIFKKVQLLEKEVNELNIANEQLQSAELRAQHACDEAVRSGKIQQETLALCYKREIEELEAKYSAELETCRVARDNAEKSLEIQTRNVSSPGATRSESSHRRHASTGFVPVKTERETLDVHLLEREACEGSESVGSSSPRVIPLEQLLSHPPAVPTHSHLVEKIEKYESRIQHLTNLLSDAEGDAARLQQLNQVLKEEIRRKERNTAREEHASNLEYLKNIVIKFATLPRGDERLRLVPVLNTILKFSREEEQRLCSAARGDVNNPGWGSYLGGIWTGNNQ